MRLSAIPLLNYQNVNSFCVGNQWIIRSGDPNTLYFQLIDLDAALCSGMGPSCPQRYIPGVGTQNQPVSMIVTFRSIDNSMITQITAVQDPNDPSVWSVTINSNQCVFGGAVLFSLTEGTSTRNFSVGNMLCVESNNAGSDGAIGDVNTFTYNPYYGV